MTAQNKMATTETAAAVTQRRILSPWLIIILATIPVFVGSLDLTVVSAFLPELLIDLGLPVPGALDDASWVVGAYLLAYAISLTFTGRLSDLIGRRSIYIVCLLVFMFGSVLVAVAEFAPTEFVVSFLRSQGMRPDEPTVALVIIIIGRVIQALGAGALVPVTLALVGDLFPPERRAQPLGFIAAVDTLGWVLGHLYGGIFVQFFAWQGLFWVNVPLTIFALVVVLLALRGVKQVRQPGRFDFIGMLLIIGAITCLNIGIGANIDVSGSTSLENLSPLPDYAPALLTAFALFMAGFIFVERRVRYPLVQLGMFRARNLSAGAVANLLIGFSLMIGLVSVPILVNVRSAVNLLEEDSSAQTVEAAAASEQSALQEAALQTGLLLSTLTIPMALAAIPGGWLTDRIGLRRTTLIGLALAVIGFVLIWQTWTLDISDLAITLQMALTGIGIGLTFSPISAAVINSAPEAERGVASALVIIGRLMGMTISISLLTRLTLQRVAQVTTEAGVLVTDPEYGRLAVGVLAELGLVGAVVCGLALLPALLLRGGERSAHVEN